MKEAPGGTAMCCSGYQGGPGAASAHIDLAVSLEHRHTPVLRTTNQTASAIAAPAGYQDVATLRSLVRRRRSTTLSALRRYQRVGRERGAPWATVRRR